ncbi:Dabb family protein [Paenibacillus sp. NPDC058071]|uniref:Dabb family protein n=1 Tax=Paenibacillus sp. NPDC058071 TaxID=3346326 RepID=UPI0036D75CE7
MITNTLLIKLKDESIENIEKARSVLLSMEGEIEVLQGLQVEANIRHERSSYDIILITRFSTMEDLEAYLIHPFHVEVQKYIAGVIESGASVCFGE